MRQYLGLVREVLEKGKWKSPVRMVNGKAVPVDGGVRTLSCANLLFEHHMSEGFPLLTTKRMAWKTLKTELEGFIKGIVSKKWYKDRGCKIWNQWANPKLIDKKLQALIDDGMEEQAIWELRKRLQLEEDDLGPIYGFQWRRFNQCYDEDDQGWVDKSVAEDADQLGRIVKTLHTNYNDRRMVCVGWNPLHISRMGLPCCHWGWNLCAIGDELNLFWAQRSCDLMLGVPFNIASYGLLLHLLSKEAGLKPGKLSGMLVDCHIYEDQIDGAVEQSKRTPTKLPTVETGLWDGIFNWEQKHTITFDYTPQEPIKFGEVVV